MTVVIDTSLWIRLLKDRSGKVGQLIEDEVGGERLVMVPLVRLELLQGCRGDAEWDAMLKRVDAFEQLPLAPPVWDGAARIYFDLRQAGFTVRSSQDCCIAQLCIDHGALLLHHDRDFETIAKVRSLKQRLCDTTPAP